MKDIPKIFKKVLTYSADSGNYAVSRLQKLVMWPEVIWKSSKIRQTRNSTACCRQELSSLFFLLDAVINFTITVKAITRTMSHE